MAHMPPLTRIERFLASRWYSGRASRRAARTLAEALNAIGYSATATAPTAIFPAHRRWWSVEVRNGYYVPFAVYVEPNAAVLVVEFEPDRVQTITVPTPGNATAIAAEIWSQVCPTLRNDAQVIYPRSIHSGPFPS